MNHFAAFCKSSAIRGLNDETEETVWSIHEAKVVHTLEWKKFIIVNGKEICFKLDSGVEVNVLPYTFTRQMKGLEIFQTNRKLTSYTGHEIKIKGIATLNCKTKNKTESLEFFIADGYYQPILRMKAIEKLSLNKKCDAVQIQQNNSAKEILNRHKNIFEGIGRLPIEHKIRLNENTTPVIAPSRKIPFSIREKVKAELERMEKLAIIEKVEEPSEWTHPIVVVQKPSGDVRIFMDPRELNKYVQRERYILPTAETLFSELKGATVFSGFDASSAFWQVPLDKESTNLCTIATPFGRFRFKRLPYGLNSASEDGSGRPRNTTEREDRAIVKTAFAAPDSTLSTIQRVTGTQVSKMTINRRLREWNLRDRRPLRCLRLTPVHRQVRLQWCRSTSLKKIAEKCEFPDVEDRLRDALVCGILSEEIQSMLLMNSMLTFKVAQEMALAHEAAVRNVAEIKDGKPQEEINVMGRAVKVRRRNEKIFKCFRCGYTNHREEQCFFKEKRCFKCQKLGHISRVCKNGNWRSDRNNNCSIDEEAEATNGLFNINQVKDTSNMRNYMVKVRTSGRDMNMLIDSGTRKNIISEKTYIRTWVKSERPRIEKDYTKLVQWNRQRLSILGKIKADVKVNKRSITMEFLVIEGPGPNLIGREAFDQIGIGLEWMNYGDSVCQINEVMNGNGMAAAMNGNGMAAAMNGTANGMMSGANGMGAGYMNGGEDMYSEGDGLS
ncbi:K02A2.6-like, partial [Cordylochernes scorpioides]